MDEDPGWPAVATSKAIVGAETFLDSRYLSIVIHNPRGPAERSGCSRAVGQW